MAPPKKNKPKVRHDPRKWILHAFESVEGEAALSYSEILTKASSLSGSEIPGYSVYQALRTLVRRGQLKARGSGRKRVYRVTPTRPTAPPGQAPKDSRLGSKKTARSDAPAPVEPSTPWAPASPAGMHKIAPGEIALLHVGETHVETATNIDGRLVLKRHERPS
ncbi:MAG: hypothetical protein ACYDFT_07780 [Thermoplasmata archaeon]